MGNKLYYKILVMHTTPDCLVRDMERKLEFESTQGWNFVSHTMLERNTVQRSSGEQLYAYERRCKPFREITMVFSKDLT